jgi:hypothetical protein
LNRVARGGRRPWKFRPERVSASPAPCARRVHHPLDLRKVRPVETGIPVSTQCCMSRTPGSTLPAGGYFEGNEIEVRMVHLSQMEMDTECCMPRVNAATACQRGILRATKTNMRQRRFGFADSYWVRWQAVRQPLTAMDELNHLKKSSPVNLSSLLMMFSRSPPPSVLLCL